ncbi:hypothetical protein [Pelagibius sp. Alg239-R121]|uniref:hypothetical protein n=1 Tax=Pelagibius sp. Alg239-R121 TaxID=2993448 RepID=UPI0024A6E5F8|nr:hypothetical protein [Pelagibius sp. Alg239-R121]
MKADSGYAGLRNTSITGVFAAVGLSLAVFLVAPSSAARADGYVSFGIGTSYSYSHHRHRHGYGWYRHNPYYGRHYYGHRHYGHHHRHHWHGTYRHVTKSHSKTVPYNPSARPKTTSPVVAATPQQNCQMIREYQTVVKIGGKQVQAYGDACMQPDGSWKLGPPKPVPEG